MTRVPFTPGRHQDEMIQFALENPRCALWAGMGMGKTVSALTVCSIMQMLEPGCDLVMAPKRVAKSVWPREAAKWEHLRDLEVSAIVGSLDEREAALARDASTYTINYENLPWLIEWHKVNKKPWRFKRGVADESTRLKNFRLNGGGGERPRAIARTAHHYIKRWVNASGTPAPNGLRDLWGQTWFLDTGQRLGKSFDAFERRWFAWERDPRLNANRNEVKMVPKEFAQEQIQGLLRDICITLDPADYFDVDKPLRRNVYVDLPAKAQLKHREMEREFFTHVDGNDIEAFNAAARTGKCLQIASGFAWVDAQAGTWVPIHDAKLQALESIVEEAAGMPVLVEYHWVPSREMILKAFPKAVFLDDKQSTEDAWNAGKIPMLVANAASAGHGLNLQDGGNILARFDHWWDLEQYDQILERIGPVRQAQAGHKRPVFDYHIVARNTWDELVMARRESKRTVQDLLLEAAKRRVRA